MKSENLPEIVPALFNAGKLRLFAKNFKQKQGQYCTLNTKFCNEFVTIQFSDEIMLITL